MPSQDDPSVTADRGPDRRAVLRGALAVTVLAGAGGSIAACGGGSGSGKSGGSGGGSGGSSAPPVSIATATVPVGGGVIVPGDAPVVVTQPTAGAFKAFSAICTHQGCTVGAVANGLIVCPCHSSEFAITDGSVKRGPATRALPARTATVQGDQVVVS